MAVEGTPSERRFGVFCKWITTVAHMAEEVVIKKKKFDANKWLTCRPWLSYSELHSCYLQFLKISVGYMQCGKNLLTNKQVSALVYYERFLTSGKHMSDDITSIIRYHHYHVFVIVYDMIFMLSFSCFTKELGANGI